MERDTDYTLGIDTKFFGDIFSMELSCFSTAPEQRHNNLSFGLSFQGYLYRNKHWEIQYFPPKERADIIITHCNGSGFPKLRVSLRTCNPLSMQMSPGPLCSTLWELRLRKVLQENSDILSTAIFPSNKVL